MKRMMNIEIFDDFVKICRKGSSKCELLVIGINDIYYFSKMNRRRNTKGEPIPLVKNLVEVKFLSRKGFVMKAKR